MALRGCELRNRDFSAKIKFLAKTEREFSTFFAISQNRCWWLHFFSTATFLFQRGYKISIFGCYNSICGYNNSFGGYYISFCGYYNSFSGCYIFKCGYNILNSEQNKTYCVSNKFYRCCSISFSGSKISFCGRFISLVS